jgi:hypothetical protein
MKSASMPFSDFQKEYGLVPKELRFFCTNSDNGAREECLVAENSSDGVILTHHVSTEGVVDASHSHDFRLDTVVEIDTSNVNTLIVI